MSNNAKVQAMIISDREHKTRALIMNIPANSGEVLDAKIGPQRLYKVSC